MKVEKFAKEFQKLLLSDGFRYSWRIEEIDDEFVALATEVEAAFGETTLAVYFNGQANQMWAVAILPMNSLNEQQCCEVFPAINRINVNANGAVVAVAVENGEGLYDIFLRGIVMDVDFSSHNGLNVAFSGGFEKVFATARDIVGRFIILMTNESEVFEDDVTAMMEYAEEYPGTIGGTNSKM